MGAGTQGFWTTFWARGLMAKRGSRAQMALFMDVHNVEGGVSRTTRPC